jgi:hypothetical protein
VKLLLLIKLAPLAVATICGVAFGFLWGVGAFMLSHAIALVLQSYIVGVERGKSIVPDVEANRNSWKH